MASHKACAQVIVKCAHMMLQDLSAGVILQSFWGVGVMTCASDGQTGQSLNAGAELEHAAVWCLRGVASVDCAGMMRSVSDVQT